MIHTALTLASALSLLAGLYHGGSVLIAGGTISHALWPIILGAVIAAFLSPADKL